MDDIPGDDIALVEAHFSGDDSAQARARLGAIQTTLVQQQMRMSLATVLSAADGNVRGLVLGTVGPGPSSRVAVASVKADRDPADLRAVAAARQVPNLTRVTLEIDRLHDQPHSDPRR